MSGRTGYIDFHYHGETFQTWFKVVGDLTSGIRPLLLLHGGPAIPNPYLEPHVELHSIKGIPVIFYDQIGCGKSTHLNEKPPSFFTPDLFMDELANVIRMLGIADSFDLYGHSWGGMLAADFVASRQPKGLNRLILANTPSSIPLFVKNVENLLEKITPGLAKKAKKHEADGTTDDKEYKDAASAFMKSYVVSMDPYPREVAEAFEAFAKDKTVHKALWGPYEFKVTGLLETYSLIDKLPAINVPTLVLNGINDEIQDDVVAPFVEKIKKVKWIRLEHSGHMPFYEEKERYFEVVGNFLSA